MYADEATVEAPLLKIPDDLLAEATRHAAARKNDFRVDGWKPSLLERLAKLVGLSG
jgi:hypothetical protein